MIYFFEVHYFKIVLFNYSYIACRVYVEGPNLCPFHTRLAATWRVDMMLNKFPSYGTIKIYACFTTTVLLKQCMFHQLQHN